MFFIGFRQNLIIFYISVQVLYTHIMKTYQEHLKSTDNHNKKFNLLKKPILRSSAIFPFIVNKNLNTNILFLGYWLLKRSIKEIKIIISVRSEKGALIHRDNLKIDKIQAFKISLKEILKVNNLKNILSGSIELEVFSLEDMIYPYPAFVVNYESMKSSTMVHTCGRIYNDLEDFKSNTKISTPESGIDILPNKNFTPFFSFVNGTKIIKKETLNLKLINFDGDILKKDINLKNIAPYETKFIYFLNNNEKKFFKNKKGTVKIFHNFNNFFPRFLSGNINKEKSISSLTHTYYDTSFQKAKSTFWKNPSKKVFYDSTIAFPIFKENGFITELAIYPNFPKKKISFDLEIFDASGKILCEIESFLRINKKLDNPIYINVNEIIDKNKIILDNNKKFFGRIIINGNGSVPARLKFALNIQHTHKYKIPSNVCFNAHVPNSSVLKKPGTFKWGPMLNKFNSIVTISNISNLKTKNKSANITLKFWSEINDKCIERNICIKDNGSYWFYLNADKKILNFLKGKSGWITIQSDNPFVNGWYFELSSSGIVGADHLF